LGFGGVDLSSRFGSSRFGASASFFLAADSLKNSLTDSFGLEIPFADSDLFSDEGSDGGLFSVFAVLGF